MARQEFGLVRRRLFFGAGIRHPPRIHPVPRPTVRPAPDPEVGQRSAASSVQAQVLAAGYPGVAVHDAGGDGVYVDAVSDNREGRESKTLDR